MKVEVRLFGSHQEAAQTSVLHEELEGKANLSDLLSRLAGKYGKIYDNLTRDDSGVLLVLNSDITRDLNAPLREGAVLIIVPAVLGG